MKRFVADARAPKLQRIENDKELPVLIRLICGGLAGATSQTGNEDSEVIPLKTISKCYQDFDFGSLRLNVCSTSILIVDE